MDNLIIKQDEDISKAIRLLRDIYSHALCESGDRSNYPCPQIDAFLTGYGIDLKEEEL
tara:strand:+ start:265 stop:438 length:174 start_codon:yes stop_codon:yes gene_type:complete